MGQPGSTGVNSPSLGIGSSLITLVEGLIDKTLRKPCKLAPQNKQMHRLQA